MKVKQHISINLFFFLLCFGMSFTHPFVSDVYGACTSPPCQLTIVPTSPITIPQDQALEPNSITVTTNNCILPISIDEGDFPPGLSLSAPIGNTYQITGTPTVAGTYNFEFSSQGLCPCPESDDYYLCLEFCRIYNYNPDCIVECACDSSCGTCDKSFPVTIYVTTNVVDASTPNPPTITLSYQSASLNGAANADAAANFRAKHSRSMQYVNTVKWKSPKQGPTPVAYAVYLDKKLTKYLTTITNEGQSRFRFKQPNKSSRRINHFYIVSIAESGSISRPAVARIKNRDR